VRSSALIGAVFVGGCSARPALRDDPGVLARGHALALAAATAHGGLERCLVFQDALPVATEPIRSAAAAPKIDPKVPYAEARRLALDAFEHGYAEALLRVHNGKVAAAAVAAGMDRVYLYRMLRRHGIK
jgi:transcriptional regulator of acetoin/glycerol metabolism